MLLTNESLTGGIVQKTELLRKPSENYKQGFFQIWYEMTKLRITEQNSHIFRLR